MCTQAFDELLATQRGSNFTMRIGIAQLTKWLHSSSEQHAAELASPPPPDRMVPKLVGPPWEVICVPSSSRAIRSPTRSRRKAADTRPEYSMTSLPVKSQRQLRQQQARRAARSAKEAEQKVADSSAARRAARADLMRRAQRGLAAARLKAARAARLEILKEYEGLKGGALLRQASASSSLCVTSEDEDDDGCIPPMPPQMARMERWEVPAAWQASWTGPLPASEMCQIVPKEPSLLRSPREYGLSQYNSPRERGLSQCNSPREYGLSQYNSPREYGLSQYNSPHSPPRGQTAPTSPRAVLTLEPLEVTPARSHEMEPAWHAMSPRGSELSAGMRAVTPAMTSATSGQPCTPARALQLRDTYGAMRPRMRPVSRPVTRPPAVTRPSIQRFAGFSSQRGAHGAALSPLSPKESARTINVGMARA